MSRNTIKLLAQLYVSKNLLFQRICCYTHLCIISVICEPLRLNTVGIRSDEGFKAELRYCKHDRMGASTTLNTIASLDVGCEVMIPTICAIVFPVPLMSVLVVIDLKRISIEIAMQLSQASYHVMQSF